MNFFEQQDIAKRNTARLVVLLLLAVLSLIAITCIFVAFFFFYFVGNNPALVHTQVQPGLFYNLWHSLSAQHIAGITAGISLVVILGGLFKYAQLRGGGRAVAAAMGARLIHGATQDPDERKILNVVEEMAIASGTSVPPVYVLEEAGINAFAAGFHPQDAVIGITRGCIHQLSRDELQGVIAHEFSHIFHGDMRLNLRLVAILHGILLIGLIGEFLLRSNRSAAFSSSRKNNRGGIMLLGLGLLVIGYAGTFFGNLIKAAVSRQREFLADASAVQFTRNPEGIAGALKKIGGASQGSQLSQANAAQFSHMYFSQGIKSLFNLMATHPPLPERIRRIQPRWDGKFIAPAVPAINITQIAQPASAEISGFSQASSFLAADLDQQLAHIAQPSQAHLDYARTQLATIPTHIKEATTDTYGARALIFGLLLDRHSSMREQQWQILHNIYSSEHLAGLRNLAEQMQQLSPGLRLPLIELCLPSLKQLSQAQLDDFLLALQQLIKADNKISLMEWSVYRIMLHNLQVEPSMPALHSLNNLRSECQLLLSMLAYAGAQTPQQASSAFAQAMRVLGFTELTLLPKSAAQLAALDLALEKLQRVKPLQKPQLLKAMGESVIHDQQIKLAEAELFRAIADCLDCPVPPFIADAKPH